MLGGRGELEGGNGVNMTKIHFIHAMHFENKKKNRCIRNPTFLISYSRKTRP